MPSGVYVITNAQNDHHYVGSAVDLRKRWTNHLYALRYGKHKSHHLQNAFRKYGEPAFQFRVLLLCDKKNLVLFEQRAIDMIQPEYNKCLMAGSSLGVRHTPETCAKHAIRMMGNKNCLGRRPSIETRAKISTAHKGRKLSAETRARMSAAQLGNQKCLGRTLSEEHKRKLAEAGSVRMSRPEERARLSARNMGNKYGSNLNLETRTKIAKANAARKGWKHSDEAKAKMSAARSFWWAEKRKLEVTNV